MPPIERPRVHVIELPPGTANQSTSTAWRAVCSHCTWYYTNTAKSDVTQHAKQHRALHRAGYQERIR